MDIFDIHPQKFYLLSPKKRTLIDFSATDYGFAEEIDQVFDSIRTIQGGNIHAVYCFYSQILEVMQDLSDKYKDRYPNVQQLPAYFKGFVDGDYFFVREPMFLF